MDFNYQFRWQQFARHLIDDLVEHPISVLPGMRELTKKYKVSRPTIERALSYLEDLGVIAPAQAGKRRQINLDKLQAISSRKGLTDQRILFLSVRPNSPGHISKNVYEAFHRYCDQEQFDLSYMEVPSEPLAIHDLLTTTQPRGVILYVVPEAVEKIVSSLNIPAIGIGKRFSLIPRFYISTPGFSPRPFNGRGRPVTNASWRPSGMCRTRITRGWR
jgi:DNA-binding transcriptional regulator YhcF (GntR family)